MNLDLALAIAASAWNVCGPRSGTPATPSTVAGFPRANLLQYMRAYARSHDGDLFTVAQIESALALLEE